MGQGRRGSPLMHPNTVAPHATGNEPHSGRGPWTPDSRLPTVVGR